MSTPKHTPGPWLRDGNTIYALMHDGWRKGVELFRNRFFAQVHSDVSCDAEEAIANASLMSAAPIMLQALKEAVPHLEYMAGGMTHAGWKTKEAQECLERVLAVIAEAEGKA